MHPMDILMETKLAELQKEYAEKQGKLNDAIQQRQTLDQAIVSNERILQRLQGAIAHLQDLREKVKRAQEELKKQS